MDKHWKLLVDQPLMCISVIGGTSNVKLEGVKKEIFCEVMLKIVKL